MKRITEQKLRAVIREELMERDKLVGRYNFQRKKFFQEFLKLISKQLKLKGIKLSQLERYAIVWSFKSSDGTVYKVSNSLRAEGLTFEIGTYVENEATEEEVLDDYLRYGDSYLDPKQAADLFIKKYGRKFNAIN